MMSSTLKEVRMAKTCIPMYRNTTVSAGGRGVLLTHISAGGITHTHTFLQGVLLTHVCTYVIIRTYVRSTVMVL